EEHQRKVKEEEERLAKEKPPEEEGLKPAAPAPAEELSEEERRLIEASAHDEDLRILPHSFALPSAFQSAQPAAPTFEAFGGPFGPASEGFPPPAPAPPPHQPSLPIDQSNQSAFSDPASSSA